MKIDKLVLYIIEILLLISVLCFAFFTEVFTKWIMAIVLLLFMVISEKLVKSFKLKGRYDKKVTSLMIIIGLVYLSFIYILGIYIGFYNATVKFSKWTLVNYIIPYIIIIISTENIRKTILLKESRKSNIILTITTIILDVALTTNIYNVKTLTDYFMLIGFILFSSIANNILYNNIIIRYRNCKAIIAYRLITILYVYIIPIIPNIHILFDSIFRMIMPYMIYLILELMDSKKEKEFLSTRKKTIDIAITSIVAFIAAIIIMLISCQFKYGALVIGSGSMTGTINKCDAIIYERYDSVEDEIKVGDIIVFYSEDIRVIHRVIDKKDSGSGIRYFTKGDANSSEDEGYREDEDILGTVKFRIPYIGMPAVMLSEMFK